MKDKIVQKVIKKLDSRSQVGIKKYNTTLESNNHDNFLLHLQEELLDGANYCEKIIAQGEQINHIRVLLNNLEKVKFYKPEHFVRDIKELLKC